MSERLLKDGPELRPAYPVGGRPLPPERRLPLVGYPGSGDRTGNLAGRQFQLDVFGEALQLFAAAERHGVLDSRGVTAAGIAAQAVTERRREPDACPASWACATWPVP
ncbi:hypothetical protein [Streptomyces sp. NPDC020607]|uniref:hypothetical protein n=1 Tax=Streptomyces sp. NPDC020607 TaxID=3365082 RepID=UPI0037ACACA8